ncbi:hypothetical protein SLA2020_044860 [Shorea laevis]
MAGMLPGVECARRRRFHQSCGGSDSPSLVLHGRTRRSSFCLYTSKSETHHTSVSTQHRNILNQGYQDEKLGGAAREAKERLDERLGTRKSEPKRHESREIFQYSDGRSMALSELQTEVFGSRKKNGSKMFSWAKLGWKASDQDECVVCLDRFKVGETLVHLPCAHRFHSRCLVPWLETNAYCPYCRMEIFSE